MSSDRNLDLNIKSNNSRTEKSNQDCYQRTKVVLAFRRLSCSQKPLDKTLIRPVLMSGTDEVRSAVSERKTLRRLLVPAKENKSQWTSPVKTYIISRNQNCVWLAVGKTCPKNERNTNSKKAIERQGRSQKEILKKKEKKRLKKTSKDARHIGADILVSRCG